MRAPGATHMSTQKASGPVTGAQAVVKDAVDPARRPDVLLRVRREPGEELSPWWNIGAFVVFSVAVVTLLSFIP
ncbi:hypothetical protein GCM10027064_17010 [Microbacterium petrolearium]